MNARLVAGIIVATLVSLLTFPVTTDGEVVTINESTLAKRNQAVRMCKAIIAPEAIHLCDPLHHGKNKKTETSNDSRTEDRTQD